MKVLTILGTRPEFIRLSLIIKKLDNICNHVVVHTGQNYDPNLNDIFFKELDLRKPDYYLEAKGSFGSQIGTILSKLEEVLEKESPDRFLVLGDTNSSLAAIMAKRLGIPVYHMEAGNRCYDLRVPEEVNRKIIDHSSDILMPYTERSRQNLISEGIPERRIYVTGNPINEVLKYYEEKIDGASIFEKLGVSSKKYFLVTLHRAENVDLPERLENFVRAFKELNKKYSYPVVWSVHPRTKLRLGDSFDQLKSKGIIPTLPMGLFDFVKLEKNAFCVLSDSGTVQEECAIFNIPNVTLRDVTERPETLEVGSNFLTGASVDKILMGVDLAINDKIQVQAPKEYLVENVSNTVCKILLSHLHMTPA